MSFSGFAQPEQVLIKKCVRASILRKARRNLLYDENRPVRCCKGLILSQPGLLCPFHVFAACLQYGAFVGPKTVRVEGVDYTADHILVAVGGRPTMPTMEGAEHCIDSNGFFLLEVSG